MGVTKRKAATAETAPESCDIKVWSGECERIDSRTGKMSTPAPCAERSAISIMRCTMNCFPI
jgi:hypothetical protein